MILSVSRYTARLDEERERARLQEAQAALTPVAVAGSPDEAGVPASSQAQSAAEPTAEILNSDTEFE